MPVPPKETIGGKIMSALKTNLRDNKKCFDFMMASVIFILAILELISMYYQKNSLQIPQIYWKTYALETYPKIVSLAFWIISIFFVAKIIRYKSCNDTKLVSLSYFLIQSINLLAVIFKFGSEIYFNIIQPLVYMVIVCLLILKTIVWFSKLDSDL